MLGVNVINIICNGFIISWSKFDFLNGDFVNYCVNLFNLVEIIDVLILILSILYNILFNDFLLG